MGAPASTVSESIGRSTLTRTGDTAFHSLRGGVTLRHFHLAWALVLLVLVPIVDNRPGSVEEAYDHANRLFRDGDLIKTQQEAERGYSRFLVSNPAWAAKFQLLRAQALIWRGMNEDALRVLASGSPLFKTK